MAPKRFIKRGPVNLDIYEKSIMVTTKTRRETVFLGREVEGKDIEMIYHLIEMGAEIQAAKMRDLCGGSMVFTE